jgi:hypothetical protein
MTEEIVFDHFVDVTKTILMHVRHKYPATQRPTLHTCAKRGLCGEQKRKSSNHKYLELQDIDLMIL